MPIVLNKANEIAVDLYLKNRIHFLEIPEMIIGAMTKHSVIDVESVEDILSVSDWTEDHIRNN